MIPTMRSLRGCVRLLPSFTAVRRFQSRSSHGPTFVRREERKAKAPAKIAPTTAATHPVAIPKSFDDIGVSPSIRAAVEELGLSVPTPVQQKSIPALMSGRSVLIADQTGSGKTLAYMIPLIEAIKDHERKTGMMACVGSPIALIVSPSRELADQIIAVAKSLSHRVKFSSAVVVGGRKRKNQASTLAGPRDLIVATPGRLRQLVQEKKIKFDSLAMIVFDEADTLFERSQGFMDDLEGAGLASAPAPTTQVVMVSATMRDFMIGKLGRRFPDLQKVVMSTLHTVVPSLQTDFVDVGSGDKIMELIDLLRGRQDVASDSKASTIIFCNSIASCRAADHALAASGLTATCVHGDIPAQTRAKNFTSFVSGEHNILVATDLACRGLDLSSAEHVIMFDFPSTPDEFLHRAGRTARAGRRGRVTVLVNKRERTVAARTKEAIEKGQPLQTLEHIRSDRAKRASRRGAGPKRRGKRIYERR